MAEFTYDLVYGASISRPTRVRKAQFGDGYQQRTGDGINTLGRVWMVRVEGYQAEIEAVDAFLANEAGVTSFDWTPPSGAAGKWLCSSWSVTPEDFAKWTLTAEFEEVFGE